MVLVPDEPDPGSTQGDEMPGRLARGRHVVDHHVVDAERGGAFAQQDERHITTMKCDLLRGHHRRLEDDPVHQAGFAAGDHRAFAFEGAVGLLQQEPKTAPGRSSADDACELGEVREADVGERKSEQPGLSGRQPPTQRVRPVAELIDRPLHPCPHRVADVRVVMHHVGHGLHRDPCHPSDILKPNLGHGLALT